jgi:polysaccharide export outer membrane protein
MQDHADHEEPAPHALGARRSTVRSRSALLLALLGALLACQTTRLTPPPQEAPPAGDYIIGEGDLLSVRVWKNQELSVDVPVRPDGMISVPLVNDVEAAGLTTAQLKQNITTKLTEYITNPDVTVVVLRADSKRVFVLGEVQRPGPVNLLTRLSVLDAISAAGGFTPFADEDDIRIIRRGADGTESEFGFDYDAYVKGRASGTNITLQPGDTIVVPQ